MQAAVSYNADNAASLQQWEPPKTYHQCMIQLSIASPKTLVASNLHSNQNFAYPNSQVSLKEQFRHQCRVPFGSGCSCKADEP